MLRQEPGPWALCSFKENHLASGAASYYTIHSFLSGSFPLISSLSLLLSLSLFPRSVCRWRGSAFYRGTPHDITCVSLVQTFLLAGACVPEFCSQLFLSLSSCLALPLNTYLHCDEYQCLPLSLSLPRSSSIHLNLSPSLYAGHFPRFSLHCCWGRDPRHVAWMSSERASVLALPLTPLDYTIHD